MDKLHLASFVLGLYHLLLKFLRRAVKKIPLIEQFSVLLYELDVEDLAVFVKNAVIHADVVAGFFERAEAFSQLGLIFIQYGGSDHVKTVRNKLLLRFVSENFKGGVIYAYNTRAVNGMAHNAAVHCCEKLFQSLIFLYKLLCILALLCHVDSYAHGTHDASVDVVKRRFIGGQKLCAFSGLNDLSGGEGLPCFHDHALGFDAGGVVIFNVPYVCVTAAFDLSLCLVDGSAEAVVHLFVNAVFVLIPDKVGDIVDSSLQKLRRLPVILERLVRLLPSEKTEFKLGL